MAYFLITQSDGDVSIKLLGKSEIESQINGECSLDPLGPAFGSDPAYWPERSCLILQGEIAEIRLGDARLK